MSSYQPLSDQLSTWSDRHAGRTLSDAAPPTYLAAAPAPGAPGYPPWLVDRALQALRQAGLQVCHGSRPRSQVLSVDQPQRRASADGLCPPGLCGTGPGVSGQLPAHVGDPGGDLRHQPRTAAPPRAALRGHGERSDPLAHRPRRLPPRRHAHRQYAGELPRPARSPWQTGGGEQ